MYQAKAWLVSPLKLLSSFESLPSKSNDDPGIYRGWSILPSGKRLDKDGLNHNVQWVKSTMNVHFQ